MLKKQNKFAAVVAVAGILVMAVALSGCAEEEEKVIVGTSADFAPFEYKEDGKIVGFDIELIKEILKDQGYDKIEVQDMGFGTLIGALKQGKIDVIAAAMTITDEREEEIDFSDPYYEADQSIIVRKNSDIQLDKNQDLQNYTVGAQTGTTGEGWVQEHLIKNGTMPEDNYGSYEKYTNALLDLINKKIDAIVLDKPVANAFERNEDVKVISTIETGEEYGFGVKEGRDKLLEKINDGLNNIKDTETWDDLVAKYFE